MTGGPLPTIGGCWRVAGPPTVSGIPESKAVIRHGAISPGREEEIGGPAGRRGALSHQRSPDRPRRDRSAAHGASGRRRFWERSTGRGAAEREPVRCGQTVRRDRRAPCAGKCVQLHSVSAVAADMQTTARS